MITVTDTYLQGIERGNVRVKGKLEVLTSSYEMRSFRRVLGQTELPKRNSGFYGTRKRVVPQVRRDNK